MDQNKRRRRVRTDHFDFDGLDNEEQKLIQQAIANSKRETKKMRFEIPEAPTYFPTHEEFLNPIEYIEKIRPEAEKSGICKIVPPKGWDPPCHIDWTSPKLFPTKLQKIRTLHESEGFDDGRRYTTAAYREMALRFEREWKQKHFEGVDNVPLEALEKQYWDMVETGQGEAVVEYGNDLNVAEYSSGFSIRGSSDSACRDINGNAIVKNESNPSLSLAPVPPPSPSPDSSLSCSQPEAGYDAEAGLVKAERTVSSNADAEAGAHTFSRAFYDNSYWNLNKLPSSPGCVLRHINFPIAGVNQPWLYLGMLFASFCWHSEDNNLFSINYSHEGAVKQWYGVPGAEAKRFEKIAKDFFLESFKESPDLLHHMTTQISPHLLIANGLPVYQIKHQPKTFVLTFAKAFHGGFSYGFNAGEAVNFGTPAWLLAGGEAEERYRLYARASVFSHHRLLFTLLHNLPSLNFSPKHKIDLATEILRIVDEDMNARPILVQQGVRDISGKVKLPTNKFQVIDKMALDYDEMRSCCICNFICVLTAVACECNRSKVSCLRHVNFLCSCPRSKKFMLAWATDKELQNYKSAMHSLVRSQRQLLDTETKPRPNTTSGLPAALSPGKTAVTSANITSTTASDTENSSSPRPSTSSVEQESCGGIICTESF